MVTWWWWWWMQLRLYSLQIHFISFNPWFLHIIPSTKKSRKNPVSIPKFCVHLFVYVARSGQVTRKFPSPSFTDMLMARAATRAKLRSRFRCSSAELDVMFASQYCRVQPDDSKCKQCHQLWATSPYKPIRLGSVTSVFRYKSCTHELIWGHASELISPVSVKQGLIRKACTSRSCQPQQWGEWWFLTSLDLDSVPFLSFLSDKPMD